MSTHKRSPGTKFVDGGFVWMDLTITMKDSLPQALNITATYEGRLKCKKMTAIFPHSPIRKLPWRIKRAVLQFPQ